MIIEPVPTSPRSRRRRALELLAVVVPVALFVAVVGAAVIGGGADTPKGLPAGVAATSTSAVPTSGGPGTPSGTPTANAALLQPAFPTKIDELTVEYLPQVVVGNALEARGTVLAIAGYFGVPIVPTDCGDGVDPLGPMCVRSGLLAETPWSLVNSEGFSDIGPHLDMRIPFGVQLPPETARTTMAASGAPLAAVIIGRFDTLQSRECETSGVGCNTGFELASVAWVEGRTIKPQPFIGPGFDGLPREWILSNREAVERATFGDDGMELEAALVRPETLAALDPAAASKLAARSPSPSGLVWYIRWIDLDREFAPDTSQVLWAIVDNVTTEVLARGTLTGLTDPAGADQAR